MRLSHRFSVGVALLFCVQLIALPASSARGGVMPALSELESRVQAAPDDLQQTYALAYALLDRVRIGGATDELTRAESLVDRLLVIAPKDSRAYALDAWRKLVAHRFTAALAAAERARDLGARDLLTRSIHADALTELGRYGEAEEAIQVLLDEHYGAGALSRAAHLRFLSGDTEGAIALAQEALSTAPSGYDQAWLSLDLAELRLQRGDAASAHAAAARAEAELPAHAVAMRGRILQFAGEDKAALTMYQRASAQLLRPEWLLEIWRLALRAGDKKQATRQRAILEGMAKLDAAKGGQDRRVFIEFYLAQPGRLANAERLASAELLSRPDLYSHAHMAWLRHLQGRPLEAHAYAVQANAVGSRDLLMQFLIGTVLAAAGDARGASMLAEARRLAPGLDMRANASAVAQ